MHRTLRGCHRIFITNIIVLLLVLATWRPTPPRLPFQVVLILLVALSVTRVACGLGTANEHWASPGSTDWFTARHVTQLRPITGSETEFWESQFEIVKKLPLLS